MSDADDTRTAAGSHKPSIVELVERLTTQISTLIRSEIALAKAEITGKVKHAGVGIGLFAAATVLVLYALTVLIFAAVAGIAEALPWWAAALIVGGSMILVATLLVLIGLRQVKQANPPTPVRAVENTKQDVQTLKEGLRR